MIFLNYGFALLFLPPPHPLSGLRLFTPRSFNQTPRNAHAREWRTDDTEQSNMLPDGANRRVPRHGRRRLQRRQPTPPPHSFTPCTRAAVPTPRSCSSRKLPGAPWGGRALTQAPGSAEGPHSQGLSSRGSKDPRWGLAGSQGAPAATPGLALCPQVRWLIHAQATAERAQES